MSRIKARASGAIVRIVEKQCEVDRSKLCPLSRYSIYNADILSDGGLLESYR